MPGKRILAVVDLAAFEIGNNPVTNDTTPQAIIAQLRVDFVKINNKQVFRLAIERIAIFVSLHPASR